MLVKTRTVHFLTTHAPGASSSTLVTGPRRSLSLKLGDARVYEPQIRARLGTTTHAPRAGVDGVPGDGLDGGREGGVDEWRRVAGHRGHVRAPKGTGQSGNTVKGFKGFRYKAMTVLYVPYSLDSGSGGQSQWWAATSGARSNYLNHLK